MSAESTATARASVLTRLRRPVGLTHGPRVGVGGVPQVSLLPAEVRLAGSAAHHRRRLIAAVVVAVLIAGGSVAAASSVEDGARSRLELATKQSSVLTGQLAKFDDVRALERRIASGRAAVKVGGATTIDWARRITDIEADKPSGYTVTGIDASGASPIADYPQGTTIVEPRRAATVVMTLSTDSVGSEFSSWLRALRAIPDCTDVSGTTSVDSPAVSTVTVTIHFGPKAITTPASEPE
jgi:hypothetical protein